MSASDPTESTAVRYRSRPTLLVRGTLLALALLLEKYFLNPFVDTQRADAAQGFGALVRDAQHFGFSFAITVALTLAVFILVDRDGHLDGISDEARHIPLHTGWLSLHLLLLVTLAASLTLWYAPSRTDLPLWLVVSCSTALAAAAIAALVMGLAPLSLWNRAAKALGIRCLYAFTAASIAILATSWSQGWWGLATSATFVLVRAGLMPFLPSLYAEPAARILGTDHFAIQVLPYCSGLEGMGLMLAFSSAWLFYFRRDYIFPRALLLIPAGLAVIFCLNAIRIASLLLIGNAGYPGNQRRNGAPA